MPRQAPYAPSEPGQPRLQSTIGRVCTSRQAATAPARDAEGHREPDAEQHDVGVTREKMSVVSKNRW